MIASLMRLFALRPFLTMAILGIPVIVLVAIGLLAVIIAKVVLFVVLPIALVVWVVRFVMRSAGERRTT